MDEAMRQAIFVVAFGLLWTLLATAGCQEEPEAEKGRRVVSVGMILGSGGLGDRSFNDAAYAGLQEARRDLGVRFEVITHAGKETDLPALRRLIRQGYHLIIGIGFENAPYIKALASKFPDRHFAVIDTVVPGANVASIVFREQEGDFLMGVLAAMLTKSRKVGFIGGMDIPPIRRIQTGFRQGVTYQDSGVTVLVDLAGTFSDPVIGKSLALAQYDAGVDVIYNAAGRTGLGIIEAAKERKRLTIGTSGDQRYLAPGFVVGNRPKRVDTAVLVLTQDLANGRFTPGVRSLGLSEEGLSIGPFDEKLVSEAVKERLESLKADIVAGRIAVKPPQ